MTLAAKIPPKYVICTGPLDDPQAEQFWLLGRALRASGSPVTLVVDRQRQDLAGEWHGCEVRIWPGKFSETWRDWRFFWQLLGEVQPQVVIASLRSTNVAMLLGYLRRVPGRIAWHRNISRQILLDYPHTSARHWLMNKGKVVVYRLATHVVPISEASRRDAVEVYGVAPARCTTIFHTCRPDPLLRLAGGRVAKSAVPPSTKRIVTVGRLVHSKGFDILLRALQQVRERNPTWTLELEIIGRGKEEARLKQLTRELGLEGSVRFLGYLPQEKSYRHYVAADVLALPYRSDPGPGVIPEGLGLGVPIIACAVDGIGELLREGDAVRLIPPEDVAALAGALQDVLSDPGLAEKMARHGRKLFEQKFNLDDWVRQVHAWLHGVVHPVLAKEK